MSQLFKGEAPTSPRSDGEFVWGRGRGKETTPGGEDGMEDRQAGRHWPAGAKGKGTDLTQDCAP